MTASQLAVLARELAQFLGSATHLLHTLHAEKRDATPEDKAALHTHDSRVMLAMTGTDPNSVDVSTRSLSDSEREQLNATFGKNAPPTPVGGLPSKDPES